LRRLETSPLTAIKEKPLSSSPLMELVTSLTVWIREWLEKLILAEKKNFGCGKRVVELIYTVYRYYQLRRKRR